MKVKFNRYFDLLIIIIVGLVPLLWFPPDHMVVGHDSGYPIDVFNIFANRFFTWNSNLVPFGSDVSNNMGSIFIHSILAVLRYLNFSLYESQKLNFVFWFTVMGASMYYFAYSLKKSIKYRFFPLIASLLYIFNFFLLDLWKLGAGTTFSGYTALPIIASFYIRCLMGEVKPVKSAIYMALVLFVFNAGGGYGYSIFGGLFVILFTTTVYFTVLSILQKNPSTIKKILTLGLYFFLFSLVLNAYWLIPFYQFVVSNYTENIGARGGVEGLINWTDSISIHTSLSNLFRLQGFPGWYDTNIVHPFSKVYLTNPFFVIVSYLFAPLAYLSIFFSKKKKVKILILLFVVCSLVAVFFSAGTHKPLGWLFIQFMKYIPGFVIFRSAQYKFVPALYFSFALLISYSVNYIKDEKIQLFNNSNISNYFKQSVLSFFVIILFIYNFPFFSNSFFKYRDSLSMMINIPGYVFNFTNWSKENLDRDKKIFILPRLNSIWKAELYNWNFFSLDSLFSQLYPVPIVENLQSLKPSQEILVNRMYDEVASPSSIFTDLVWLLQIKYALLRDDSKFDLDWIRSDPPQEYKNLLSGNKYLKNIWSEGKWNVYEVDSDNPFDKIYGLGNLTKFIGSERDILAPVIDLNNNFYQVNDEDYGGNSELLKGITDKTIYSSNCVSCLLDSHLEYPVITPSSVLPGSLFYFIKQSRENKLESPKLSPDELVANKLGLSQKRIGEISSLVLLRMDEADIYSSLKKLSNYWNFIYKYLNNAENNNKYLLLRTIKSYAEFEKKYLLHFFNNTKGDSVRAEMMSLMKLMDKNKKIISNISANYRNTNTYLIPKGLSDVELFYDKKSLNINRDGAINLPEYIYIYGKKHEINPQVVNEKVMLGKYNLENVSDVNIYFPETENLLAEASNEAIISPEYRAECVVWQIDNYDNRADYKIDITPNNVFPSDTRLYLKRYFNDANVNKSNLTNKSNFQTHLFEPDLLTSSKQTLYFSGKDGEKYASVSFCSSYDKNPQAHLADIQIKKVISPTLFFSTVDKKQTESPVSKIVYKKINPTKYVLYPENSKIPSIVVFHENYNYNWKLYQVKSEKTGMFNSVTNTWFKKPIDEDKHFKLYGFANGWVIEEDTDGVLVLEFRQQKLFYVGIIITVFGVVAAIGIVLSQRQKLV
ncbi:hypothetical protein ACFL1A_00170 [Patescibacteria group bacterium]